MSASWDAQDKARKVYDAAAQETKRLLKTEPSGRDERKKLEQIENVKEAEQIAHDLWIVAINNYMRGFPSK